MSVGTVCTREVITARRDETVREAAMRMQEHHVGTLLVVDAERHPQGIMTDRDIVIRCVAKEFDPRSMRVREAMSEPVVTIHQDVDIETALERMAALEVRRLAVTDADGRLVGLLALDDVMELLVDETREIGRVLRGQVPV